MGGINHQPCRAYLPESTRLSRFVSLARLQFEQANVALEDVIILELEHQSGSVNPIKHHLQLSQDHIISVLGALKALKEKMDTLAYQDLSPLSVMDSEQVGSALTRAGFVEQSSWHKMISLMKKGTFYANVKEFESQMANLLKLTQHLLSAVCHLADFADDGTLHEILEGNREGNIKASFARLYTAWNQFHGDFLASSLVSTEVWYAENGFGSLLTKSADVVALAVTRPSV